MTKVTIDRELLERLLYVMDNYVTHETPEEDELRAILAAQRQPEGEGLEVVGYASECGLAVLHGLPVTGAIQIKASAHKVYEVPLCRLSDAQRAIAELREECERLHEAQKNYFSVTIQHGSAVAEAQAERDTLHQQLAERDAEILEQCRLNGMGAERELKLIAQRDKLAELLRYARRHVAATRYPDNDEGDYHERRRDGLLRNINAALAEVGG